MAETVRRSKRIALKADELSITSDKKLTSVNKTDKIAKPVTKSKKVKKEEKKIVEKAITKKGVKKNKKVESEKKEKEEVEEDKEDVITLSDDLEVGDSIPKNLELELQDSTKINLLKYAKDAHILVIFAYPRASTPGCTRQACGFRDEYKKINGKFKAKILGLSADSSKAQTTFKLKQKLPYDLLCDVDRKLITLLGIKKVPKGIIRSHFVFVDGVLKIKNVKVSPEQSYTSALKQVEELSK